MRTLLRLLPGVLFGLLLGLVPLAGCHGRTKAFDLPSGKTVDKAREAEIQNYPWPEYVTGEDRNRVEEGLRAIFDVGGYQGRQAEKMIVDLDRTAEATQFRAVGRLVSEMKTVIDTVKLDNWEGMSRIMVLDRMLRQIDGVQERVFGEWQTLDIEDSPKRALRLVSAWNWWYREGRFGQRYKPWDVREDLTDNPEDG